MTIYLYKKTHNKTGLQYLGKTTSSDPHKYRGSGHIWKLHIKKHGYDVTTEILKECNSTAETKFWGEYYSNLWNVVESDGWGNLKPESGDGGRVPDEVRDTKSWNTLAAISKRSGSNHYSKKLIINAKQAVTIILCADRKSLLRGPVTIILCAGPRLQQKQGIIPFILSSTVRGR